MHAHIIYITHTCTIRLHSHSHSHPHPLQVPYRRLVVEILNEIFGRGKKQSVWWKDTLPPLLEKQFNVTKNLGVRSYLFVFFCCVYLGLKGRDLIGILIFLKLFLTSDWRTLLFFQSDDALVSQFVLLKRIIQLTGLYDSFFNQSPFIQR